jgi:hypothetical protein
MKESSVELGGVEIPLLRGKHRKSQRSKNKRRDFTFLFQTYFKDIEQKV